MSIAVANQYAKALLDVVMKDGSEAKAEAVLAELETFRDALSISPELREVLMSPAADAESKRRALLRVASMIGLSPMVVNFVSLLKTRRRIPLTNDICLMFREQMDSRLGIVRAHLKSARPLDDAQKEALDRKLEAATGKRVDWEYAVDPELVGGATVTIGSTVFDGSVRGQLEDLRARLTKEG